MGRFLDQHLQSPRLYNITWGIGSTRIHKGSTVHSNIRNNIERSCSERSHPIAKFFRLRHIPDKDALRCVEDRSLQNLSQKTAIRGGELALSTRCTIPNQASSSRTTKNPQLPSQPTIVCCFPSKAAIICTRTAWATSSYPDFGSYRTLARFRLGPELPCCVHRISTADCV
jgi:hypothetical protein